ncbi:hypothetical protein BN1708_017238, partial [Verticillium longisporum]
MSQPPRDTSHYPCPTHNTPRAPEHTFDIMRIGRVPRVQRLVLDMRPPPALRHGLHIILVDARPAHGGIHGHGQQP